MTQLNPFLNSPLNLQPQSGARKSWTSLRRSVRAALAIASVSALFSGAALQAQMQVPHYQSPGVSAPQPAVPQFNIPPTPPINPNAQVVEDVLVQVNDQIISRTDLERAAQGMQQELAQTPGLSESEVQQREKNLLRDLIDQQLLLSRGKEMDVNVDADVVRRLDEMRKQYNLPSMEALEEAAKQQGISFEDFKANIKNQLISQTVVREEVGRSIRISHADEVAFYNAHKDQFAQPEQVRLSEILIPVAANADESAVASAQKRADAVEAELKGGADFAATAKKDSGGPTASAGGDLGQFKPGALAPALEQKTFPLPVGQFTEPIRTRQGFVILKVTEHQKAGIPPLDQVETEVQNALYGEQIQPALRAYLSKLRDQSYINIRPGFVDTGATPNEGKATFTTYTPPKPKAKAVAKKRAQDLKIARAKAEQEGKLKPAVVKLDKHGKPKKVKREKVRFGQAPREALPDTDTANATTASSKPGSVAADAGESVNSAMAPGNVISPQAASANTVAANATDENPLDQTAAAPKRKTRYADREPEVKAKKAKVKSAKLADEVAATPDGPTTAEQQARQIQSAPLGLGDTTKSKKHKHKKGEKKERIQQKPEAAKPALVDNGLPARLHQVNGPTAGAGTGTQTGTPNGVGPNAPPATPNGVQAPAQNTAPAQDSTQTPAQPQ